MTHKQHGCDIPYTMRCVHKPASLCLCCSVCKLVCVRVCFLLVYPGMRLWPSLYAVTHLTSEELCFFLCCWLTDTLFLLCPPVNSLARSKYCWHPIRKRKRTRQCPTRTLFWAQNRPLHPTGPLSLDPLSPSALLTHVLLQAEVSRRKVDALGGEGRKVRMGGRGQRGPGWGCVSCCRQGGWVSDLWGST